MKTKILLVALVLGINTLFAQNDPYPPINRSTVVDGQTVSQTLAHGTDSSNAMADSTHDSTTETDAINAVNVASANHTGHVGEDPEKNSPLFYAIVTAVIMAFVSLFLFIIVMIKRALVRRGDRILGLEKDLEAAGIEENINNMHYNGQTDREAKRMNDKGIAAGVIVDKCYSSKPECKDGKELRTQTSFLLNWWMQYWNPKSILVFSSTIALLGWGLWALSHYLPEEPEKEIVMVKDEPAPLQEVVEMEVEGEPVVEDHYEEPYKDPKTVFKQPVSQAKIDTLYIPAIVGQYSDRFYTYEGYEYEFWPKDKVGVLPETGVPFSQEPGENKGRRTGAWRQYASYCGHDTKVMVIRKRLS